MKAFVILDCYGLDYEGSSTEIVGIFSSEKAALGRVRKDIPNAKRFATHWEHPDKQGYDFRDWTLEKWKVED